MRKPIEQKPPLAAWATTARAEAGMSIPEVVDALAARGHRVTEATIRGIEGGSKGAGARLIRLLAEVYGKPIPLTVPTPTDSDPVAAAIDRLGDRLIAAIEAQGEVHARSLDTLAELLGGALSELAANLGRTPDGPAGGRGAGRVGASPEA